MQITRYLIVSLIKQMPERGICYFLSVSSCQNYNLAASSVPPNGTKNVVVPLGTLNVIILILFFSNKESIQYVYNSN